MRDIPDTQLIQDLESALKNIEAQLENIKTSSQPKQEEPQVTHGTTRSS